MAYEKQSWKTGDIITQQKMNYIEDGIINSRPMIIHRIQQDENSFRYDKTWQEIYDAMISERPVYEIITQSTPQINGEKPFHGVILQPIHVVYEMQDLYKIKLSGSSSIFYCANPNDYPIYEPESSEPEIVM